MANASGDGIKNIFCYDFPLTEEGNINAEVFLESAEHLVSIVERLGTAFTPVKYDMQGNIDKIKKTYVYTKNSCLLDLVTDELSKNQDTAAEGVFWLNRALSFFEILLTEMLKYMEDGSYHNVSMRKLFTLAYEGSIKKYHNWMTQQIFHLVCKMSPSFQQILKNLGAEPDDPFRTRLSNYILTLKHVRIRIDQYFIDRNKFIK